MLWIGAIFGALFGWVGILAAAFLWVTLAIIKLLWNITVFMLKVMFTLSELVVWVSIWTINKLLRRPVPLGAVYRNQESKARSNTFRKERAKKPVRRPRRPPSRQ